MAELLIPLFMVGVSVAALSQKQDVYSALLDGGRDGLRILLSIVPALVMLLAAVHMLRASGAINALSALLAPLFRLFGIPPESQIGRTAAVMLGSTETTFYTISVYFGANRIRKTRYAIPAALVADFTGFLVAAWTVRLFMG